MTASTTEQPTGFRHPYMTPKQAKWVFDLINTRIGRTGAAFDEWKSRYFAIDSRSTFDNAIRELRTLPLLADTLPSAAEGDGLYRDPNTGKLYRLATPKGRSWERIVSAYSEVSRARRLLTTGEEVAKGTWKRWNAFQSRQALIPRVDRWYIRDEWFMTDEDKVEYATGICNFCYLGLVDARSVRHNYGPKCAKKHNLPWGD